MSDRDQDRPSNSEDIPVTKDATPKPNPNANANDDDRFECRACGHVYNPDKGDAKSRVLPGTPFSALAATWACPVCDAKQTAFTNIGTSGNDASGFKENMKYGFGVNTMTQGQKSLLIYGGLGIGILIFLSLYTLE